MLVSTRSGWLFALFLCPALAVGGCASSGGGKVNVSMQLDTSILIDRLPVDKRIVYIDIRNKTGVPGINITPKMKKALEARGYRVTKNPHDAHYEIKATLLYIGPGDPAIAEAMFNKGYGTPVYANAMGMDAEQARNATKSNFFLISLLSGVSSTLQDWVTTKAYFVILADLRISEYSDDRGVREKIHYTTRMMSTARGMNLEFPDALVSLKGAFVNTVSDIFRGS